MVRVFMVFTYINHFPVKRILGAQKISMIPYNSFFAEEVFLKLDTNYIEVFEDDDVTLCVSIATNVACAVGFGAFDVEISLSSIEGINPIVASPSMKTLSCNTIKIGLCVISAIVTRIASALQIVYWI